MACKAWEKRVVSVRRACAKREKACGKRKNGEKDVVAAAAAAVVLVNNDINIICQDVNLRSIEKDTNSTCQDIDIRSVEKA